VEASALPASVGLARTRISIGASLLRLRSDEQLVSLFRAGNEEAFRIIHDRYRQRLFAYTRQMLAGSPQDAEDALQEIFVRAYAGLRANDRQLALRAWLYRVAHNRCIDELRRPPLPAPEVMDCLHPPGQDPATKVEQRDALRRLIADVQRLPDQQRSALLMRELGGMSYADLAGALGVTIPAVKSLLVRARVGLTQASEARDIACPQIREELIVAHDRGVRASGVARRHMRDCRSCREFRSDVRGVSRQFAALAPALGPAGVLAKLLGLGGGAGGGAAAGSSAAAGSGAAAGSSAAAAGGAVGAGGAIASAGALASGASHVVTLLAAAVVTAGGAVEVQQTISPPIRHHVRHHRVVVVPHQAATPQAYVAPPSAPPAHISAPAAAAPAQPATPPAPSHPAVKPAARVSSSTQPASVKSASSAPADPSSTTGIAGAGPDPSSAGVGKSGSGSDLGSPTSTPVGSSTPATGSTTTAPAVPSTGSTAGGTTDTTGGLTTASDGSSSTDTGVDGTSGASSASPPSSPAASVPIGSGTGSSGASSATGPFASGS
jgi:RNA polymerase sigma factor (sigma-70 family)